MDMFWTGWLAASVSIIVVAVVVGLVSLISIVIKIKKEIKELRENDTTILDEINRVNNYYSEQIIKERNELVDYFEKSIDSLVSLLSIFLFQL